MISAHQVVRASLYTSGYDGDYKVAIMSGKTTHCVVHETEAFAV